jgi:hypothetical protein
MYDAWAAYDEKAVGTRLGGSLRRPASERTKENKEKAIAYAAYRSLLFVYSEAIYQAYFNGTKVSNYIFTVRLLRPLNLLRSK